MRRLHLFIHPAGLAMCLGLMPVLSAAQNVPMKIEIPVDAIRLEGIPKVRTDEGEARATRRVLQTTEAIKERLVVRVRNGEFYWETRDNRRLRLNTSGAFTYLSAEPGHYIRLTRVGDKLSYVEHVEMDSRSVTWRGELTIVLGKKP